MNNDQINDLILKNISFSYYEQNNKKIILDNFNYKIKKGKFTSIIGPSGTGKTSLLTAMLPLSVVVPAVTSLPAATKT